MSIAELKTEANRVMQPGPAVGHSNVAAAITEALFARGRRDAQRGVEPRSDSAAYVCGYRIAAATVVPRGWDCV